MEDEGRLRKTKGGQGRHGKAGEDEGRLGKTEEGCSRQGESGEGKGRLGKTTGGWAGRGQDEKNRRKLLKTSEFGKNEGRLRKVMAGTNDSVPQAELFTVSGGRWVGRLSGSCRTRPPRSRPPPILTYIFTTLTHSFLPPSPHFHYL